MGQVLFVDLFQEVPDPLAALVVDLDIIEVVGWRGVPQRILVHTHTVTVLEQLVVVGPLAAQTTAILHCVSFFRSWFLRCHRREGVQRGLVVYRVNVIV